MDIRLLLLIPLAVFAASSCSRSEETSTPGLFRRVSAEHSGLLFSNTITETDSFNILDYEYLYNGGGVGVADFNNDGLPDLVFSGNQVPSRIYLNKGDFQFEDITQSSGFITNAWCTGVSLVDINNDGRTDIHIATAHDQRLNPSPNYFFLNTTEDPSQVRFEEAAAKMGIADSSYTVQAAWFDYDKDRDLDLFLINNSLERGRPRNAAFGQRKDGKGPSTDKLYENTATSNGYPQFKDVSTEAGILVEGWSLGVLLTDINNDNYPDIYVANDFLSNDLLYINNKDGTFTNRITDFFKHQSHNSMGADAADINNDGLMDFLVLDMLPEDNLRQKTMFSDIPYQRFEESIRKGYQPQYVRNVLQLNRGNGNFSDIGYYSGLSATDWSWSPLLADFDNDGLKDAYITNGYKKDITDMDFVDFNSQTSSFGTERDRRNKLLEQLRNMEGVKKSNFLFKGAGKAKFREVTEEAGLKIPSYSNGAAYADLDLDGDLDLITNNLDEPAFIFENLSVPDTVNSSNYLRIALPADPRGIGTKVWGYASDHTYFAEFYPQRGYLSTLEPVIHLGLGDQTQLDSLKILWPDGRIWNTMNVKSKQLLEPLAERDKNLPTRKTKFKQPETIPFFKSVASGLLPCENKEQSHNDLREWPLLFRGYSDTGTVMAKGDVNNDGLEDVFVGGPAGYNGSFFLQGKEGGFMRRPLMDSIGSYSEDTAAILLDLDNDGDLDLYAASGSSENYKTPSHWQDRIYLNDGSGHFRKAKGLLPKIDNPTATVVPGDFDRDGDLDLFVGGRVLPNQYPLPPRSYLLENKDGRLVDATEERAKELLRPGMVTAAVWEDLDGNNWPDLILVGEWMAVTVYYNTEGRLQKAEAVPGLEKSHGWWNCIKGADFDRDGDTDFVIGNWGLNNPFTASEDKPLRLYAKDFDGNGQIEPLFAAYNGDREYLRHPKGTLAKRLPAISKITNTYKDYGMKTAREVLESLGADSLAIFNAYRLESVFLENLGNRNFKIRPLPYPLQWSPVLDFEVLDLNEDGWLDLIAVGNYNSNEVLSGHYDASEGSCLLNRGNWQFEVLSSQQSGLKVNGVAKSLIKLAIPKAEDLLFVGKFQDSLQIFRIRQKRSISRE